MPLTIRPIDATRPKNRTILDKLDRRCFQGDEPCDKSEGHWWLVTDAAGTPVAFAGVKASVQWRGTGYLCRVGVRPSARGQGLQKRLIRVRERKARLLGWTHLVTDTSSVHSGNNLMRCGYKMYEPNTPWCHGDTIYLIKAL